MSQQRAELCANVILQIVRGMIYVYNDADLSQRTIVSREFKTALSAYLKTVPVVIAATELSPRESASVYEGFPFIGPYNDYPVLFKNLIRSQPQGENTDFSSTWIAWTIRTKHGKFWQPVSRLPARFGAYRARAGQGIGSGIPEVH